MTEPIRKTRQADRPVRIGVFPDVPSADAAIVRLLNAGFTKSEITVVAPASIKEHFAQVQASTPGGSHAAKTATAMGAAGAMLGGVIAAATVVATGGAALIVAGPLVTAAAGGALAGGFIGAMLSRGFEKETAQFYDQALRSGKILVGVDLEDGQTQRDRLELAERVLSEAGADPLPLKKG